MKICVVGIGYVGLVTGACLADMGNEVVCIDIDNEKIERLKNNRIPIYEPGLEEVVKRNQQDKRLKFGTELREAVEEATVIFIAVGTPPGPDGAADLQYVFGVAADVGKYINDYKVIINKSTVPVGTAEKVREVIARELDNRNVWLEYDVVSNPEFLKEGAAIADFQKPDRIVLGSDSPRAIAIMKELYSSFTHNNHPIVVMDTRSAEMTKYVANAALACRISFINEMANICEKVGADINNVRIGIGTDSRIGMSFLYAGLGYGGSCFPKDVQALSYIADEHGVKAEILQAIQSVNHQQKQIMIEKIHQHFNGRLEGVVIAVWGLAFKPNTDDVREAPSLTIINSLLSAGAIVQAYDPVATGEAKKALGHCGRITYYENQYDALSGAEAMLLITEWSNFRRPDFEKMHKLLKKPVIFDGRNQYDPEVMRKNNYIYYSIGR